ncbi:MAG: phosphopantetheine-binding protein [Terrimicrobiaceae bacterium]|jgi:acyl carrier protein|nr:phosphopantetheine-binding protein [Terrimicrobiaceae bacterium]
MAEDDLKKRIKQMLVSSLMLKLAPDAIGDTTLLFSSEGLALDSIDALELAVAIEKNFGVATPSAEVARNAFVSVNTIADYIHTNNPSA